MIRNNKARATDNLQHRSERFFLLHATHGQDTQSNNLKDRPPPKIINTYNLCFHLHHHDGFCPFVHRRCEWFSSIQRKNVYILASRDPGDTTDYMQRSVTLVFAKPFPPRLFHLITTVLLPLLVLYNPLWLAGLKTPTNHLTVVATDYVSVRDSSRIHFTQSILPCFVLFIVLSPLLFSFFFFIIIQILF